MKMNLNIMKFNFNFNQHQKPMHFSFPIEIVYKSILITKCKYCFFNAVVYSYGIVRSWRYYSYYCTVSSCCTRSYAHECNYPSVWNQEKKLRPSVRPSVRSAQANHVPFPSIIHPPTHPHTRGKHQVISS